MDNRSITITTETRAPHHYHHRQNIIIFNSTLLLLLLFTARRDHGRADLLYNFVSFTSDFCHLPTPSHRTRSIILDHLFLFLFSIVPPPTAVAFLSPHPPPPKPTRPLTPSPQPHRSNNHAGAKITRPSSSSVDRLMLLVYTPEVLLLYTQT